MLSFLMKLVDSLSNTIVVQLVIMGEFYNHGVVGDESVSHHPLALEDLLLHRFEPGLHASSPP